MSAARPVRQRSILAAPIAAALLWAALVGAVEWLRPAGSQATVCMLRNLTGLPCPACGSTRAARAALDGRLLDALAHNPLVVIGVAAGLAWPAWRVVRPRRSRHPARDTGRGAARRRVALWITAAVLAAVNWGWVIVHHGAPG